MVALTLVYRDRVEIEFYLDMDDVAVRMVEERHRPNGASSWSQPIPACHDGESY